MFLNKNNLFNVGKQIPIYCINLICIDIQYNNQLNVNEKEGFNIKLKGNIFISYTISYHLIRVY